MFIKASGFESAIKPFDVAMYSAAGAANFVDADAKLTIVKMAARYDISNF